MSADGRPPSCTLCGASRTIRPAGFRQLYARAGAGDLIVAWWECEKCRGWFAFPTPSPADIERHWGTVDYHDEGRAADIAAAKRWITVRMLRGLSGRTAPGRLLDVGCNFGNFMVEARADGWLPTGFEPSERAAKVARNKGFEVRCRWDLDEAGFRDGEFDAISAIDVFYYALHPNTMLRSFRRLLRPGAVLAMRITNKRLVLGVVRALVREGERRDRRLSRMLKDQFHAIGLGPLTSILRDIGFTRFALEPGPPVTRWTRHPRTHAAYLASDIAARLSLGTVNLAPAVLLFAETS